MKIGIDISQIAHEGTGVARYVRHLIAALVKKYPENEYLLLGASLRKRRIFTEYVATLPRTSHIHLILLPVPPILLDWIWNRLHIIPVEWVMGPLDIFWSSDWTQPPLSRAVGVTTIHDLSILRYPQESHSQLAFDVANGRVIADIVATQRRRLTHAVKECSLFFCDSQATKKDAHELLGISEHKLSVVYPGLDGGTG